jgi:hypothetical protein
MTDNPHQTEWIICFTPHTNRGTWRLFTFWRPQHQHCFAVRYHKDIDAWIYVECSSKQFHFDLLTGDKATELINYMMKECECISIKIKPITIFHPRWLYCVSFVKHLIGIRGFFILTPYHLRCELLKLGGKVIFNQLKEK